MTNTTEHFVFFSFLTHNQHSEKGRMRERWREWRLKMFWQKREMSSFDSQWSKNTLLRNTYTRRKEWERNGRRWNGETRRIKELKNRVIELNVNISVLIPTAWCTHTHTPNGGDVAVVIVKTGTTKQTSTTLLLSAWYVAHDGWK